MKAVWYEQNGPAEVMQYGEMPEPEPGPGEVRVALCRLGSTHRTGNDGPGRRPASPFLA